MTWNHARGVARGEGALPFKQRRGVARGAAAFAQGFGGPTKLEERSRGGARH